jgi:achaete-scute complex protein
MAATVRTMTLGQNFHMIPQNCVIVSNMLPNSTQQMYSHGKRPIAPAIEPRNQTVLTSNGINQPINIKPKQKYNYGSMPYPNNQTVSVARRNARERNRVKQVNNGFSTLRQHIPQHVVTQLTKGGRGSSKKLSKVDTLKLAVEYIRKLKDMLEDNENNDGVSTSTGCSQASYYSDSSHLQSLSRSEASLSPTPSYSSEASSTLSYTPNHLPIGQQHFKNEPYDSYVESSTSPAPSYHSDVPVSTQQYPHSSTPYINKPIPYNPNPYESITPEDEDLLDAISWWQQQ